MSKILFPFIYLLELVKENIAKTIIIIIACISLNYAGKIPDTQHEVTILKEVQINGKWIYIHEEYDGDLDIFYKTERLKLTGKDKNKYRYKQYSPGNILLGALFFILVIILIVMLTSDGRWDFRDVFENTIKYYIRCEIEDKFYVYTIFGRLIEKSNYQTNNFNIYNLRDITILPKYKLRSEKRNEKLNKILK